MPNQHRRFLWVLAGSFMATLLPIAIANFVLLSNSYGNNELVLKASQWQQATHGTTFAGGVAAPDGHRLFKTLRLHDRLMEINTVVLGSSTVMGITQSAFPERFKIYNIATNSNPLFNVIGEAEYIQKYIPSVKWLIIPMDWSLGFIYLDARPAAHDLSLPEAMRQIKSNEARAPVTERMRDAVSYPRIVSLLKMLKSAFRSNDKIKAVKNGFLIIGDEYVCPDGALGKDFDPMYRGICAGFRYDGSATFANLNRVGEKAQNAIRGSLDTNWQYAKSLRISNGVPNTVLLERLVNIDKRAKQNGGGIILLRPPMLSGLEAEFMRQRLFKDALLATKNILDTWVRQHQLKFIDAGQAEQFGCTADEFVDAHHAVNTCYRKIFDLSLPSLMPKG